MKIIKEPNGVDFTVVNRRFTDEEANELLEQVKNYKASTRKQFIPDPNGVDFTVIPKHLTDEEANEISDYIKKYKAAQNQALEVKVLPANSQELDFLLTLLQRLNIKWTLVGG